MFSPTITWLSKLLSNHLPLVGWWLKLRTKPALRRNGFAFRKIITGAASEAGGGAGAGEGQKTGLEPGLADTSYGLQIGALRDCSDEIAGFKDAIRRGGVVFRIEDVHPELIRPIGERMADFMSHRI